MGCQYGSVKREAGNLAQQNNKRENFHGGFLGSNCLAMVMQSIMAIKLFMLQLCYNQRPSTQTLHSFFFCFLIFKQAMITYCRLKRNGNLGMT